MAEGQGRFFPEQGNRQPPRGMERRGGTRLNVTGAPPVPGFRPGGVTATPDRPIAPTLPRPATAPSVPEHAPQKPKKHTVRNIALAGTALGVLGVGAGVYEAYENVPAVHRVVDSAFLDHIKGKSSSPEALVFNPTATEGVIKPSMIERLPQEEIEKLDPFAKIDDHNTVLALYPIDVSTSDKPDAKISYKKTYTGNGNEQDRRNRAEQGFFNVFDFESVPAGSTIRAPVDGLLTIYDYSRGSIPTNDHPFGTAAIDFLVNGEEYRLIIGGEERTRGPRVKVDVFRSLTNAPIIGSSMSPDEKRSLKGIPIKRGAPILQVADKEVHVTFVMRGSIDMSKMELKKAIIDGKTVTIAMENPINLELFLSNGAIVAPAQTKQHLP